MASQLLKISVLQCPRFLALLGSQMHDFAFSIWDRPCPEGEARIDRNDNVLFRFHKESRKIMRVLLLACKTSYDNFCQMDIRDTFFAVAYLSAPKHVDSNHWLVNKLHVDTKMRSPMPKYSRNCHEIHVFLKSLSWAIYFDILS